MRMRFDAFARYGVPSLVVAAVALALSLLWHVPYVFTLIGFSAWAFFGHLVTADDDARGGWSNPDGSFPFPWGRLILKALVFVTLCVLAVEFPVVRGLGGS